ncbi:MAG: hypothetical protein K2X66_16200, partial [Cyanobacteria bacterium]|nr:hypothetical protein [Cyanobacteriota bacterium]
MTGPIPNSRPSISKIIPQNIFPGDRIFPLLPIEVTPNSPPPISKIIPQYIPLEDRLIRPLRNDVAP